MMDLSRRVNIPELMDDLSRPAGEFTQAHRELAAINRWLGGVRAVERFLPARSGLTILDIAAGGCDVGEALVIQRGCRVVSLDMNPRGLYNARQSLPVVGDAMQLPFSDCSFDVVVCSLFFHHLSDAGCARVLTEMWRTARMRIIVNDLHRQRIAFCSIRILSFLFSRSAMVKHDGPLSVRRAFVPGELREIANGAGITARVCRSFPYRLVLIAEK